VTVADEGGVSVDAFIGGRVTALQHGGRGHRSGLEAVLLAASIDDGFAGTVVDLGAGAGVAGMCIAARAPGARAVLVDRDIAALENARSALALPGNRSFAERVSIVAVDIAAPETERVAAGLGREFAEGCVLNPPFYAAGKGTHSPEPARSQAHVLGEGGLEPWLKTAASVLKPNGHIVAIFRADGLPELMSSVAGRFGDIDLLPIHARTGLPAHRVLLRAFKGSRGPLAILPGLALHTDAGNSYLPAAETVLRNGVSLAEAHPPWAR
jgi:tRNA1(Val) A37 N6-methylase TrmN6